MPTMLWKRSLSIVQGMGHSRGAGLPDLARAILFFTLLSPAAGQVLTGEIDGTIQDSSGAVVPDATVAITNTDENLLKRTVKSDTQGNFAAPLLSVGNYAITVTAPGFQTYTASNVEVHVGQPSVVPIALSLGGVSQSVNVTANAVAAQVDSAAASTLIDSRQITQLSLSSRNYLQLLLIQPGISGGIPGPNERGNITTSGAVNTQTFSVNGNGTASNAYFVDGADTLKRAGQQPVAFPGVDFIREINLQRASYGAEFGGAGAAHVSVQTKSGGTDFHGSAFGFFRSQIFNANTYFNNSAGVPRGGQRYADFGYAAGGPVWIPKITQRNHSRTFFFFGQEFLRTSNSVQQNITNIPNLGQRSGNFRNPVCTAYNGAGRCASAVNSITAIDPTARQYLTDIISKLPLPNNPADPQGLITQATGTNDETQTIIRVDHQFSDSLSVFFRYLDDPFHLLVPNGFQSTSSIPGVATSTMTNGSTNWLGHATYVFGAHHVLEGGYSSRSNWVTAQAIGYLLASNSPDIQVQLPYPSTLARVPNININGSNYNVSSPYDERNPVKQIFLNNTNSLGRHTLKLGMNIELQSGGSTASGANAGNFSFAPGTLPGGATTQFEQAFANFLLGRPASFTQANIDVAGTNKTNIYEGYVQDDFRASKRLTVTGGVRYSYFASATIDQLENRPALPPLNFDPSTYRQANAPAISSAGLICTSAPCPGGRVPNPDYSPLNGIIIAGQNSPYGSVVQVAPDKSFAPRFGFTYDLHGDGSAALRGGYGIYYFATPANQAKFATSQNFPNVVNTTIANPSFANPGSGVPALSSSPNILQALEVHAAAPYSQQYSLDYQQRIGSGTVVDLGYYGNRGVHLFANLDINQAPAGLYAQRGLISGNVVNAGNTPVLNQLRPYAGYSAIVSQSNIFNSNYNSLQASLRQRLRGGAIVTASYTWSKALTDARTPQDSSNRKAEYGHTPFDRKHVFNASFVYPIDFFKSRRSVASSILGGFQVSGIVTYGSGQYLTPATSALDSGGLGLLVGPATGRPDTVGDPNANAPHEVGRWFDTSAFQPVPAGQYRPGNSGVTTILGPGYGSWDLSLFRTLKIEGLTNFQIRAEAFNTFNHTNFNTVQTTLGTTNYGQVTSVGPSRTLQFGAKLTF